MLLRVPTWLRGRGKGDSFDRAVAEYETEIHSERASLSRYWAELGAKADPSILAALVKVDLQRRFEAGERPKILEYLQEFPILAEVDDRVISLVYEEFCLLEEAGERPDPSAFCEAYGPWRDSLRSQLVYHRELSRAVGVEAASVTFPEPGDRFEKYHLTSILGVGGVARVYLATEEELGGRQVAIKVSASFGQEPSILAKLDHRSIVPILTVAHSETGLRGICMPYRPGATLEDLIQRIGRKSTPPKLARAIDDALLSKDSPADFPPEEQRVGWAGFPADRSFPEAVAWIGLALANALGYLHEQGVYHRDIKPANILLAYREGPQLLDFNLAQIPSNPEGASAAQKGGTLPYMAPEQLRAFLDPSAWDDVESAADLYSLGLVLRELLTGKPPELPTSQGTLAREIQSLIDRRLAPSEAIGSVNRSVPAALESIVDRCLAFRPEDRYGSAAELAADLRRFLDRKPLLIAPNTSKVELAFNWFSRNWRAAVGTGFSLIVIVAFLSSFGLDRSDHSRFAKAESYLDSSNRADWEIARGLFQQLYSERRETARSALGLALTLRKLGDPNDLRFVNELFYEADNRVDSEEVLRDRIRIEPNSDLLYLNLGIVLAGKQRYGLAREALEHSLKIDPGGFSANVMLARLNLQTGRHRDTVTHLARAIELARKNRGDPSTIYKLRGNLLDVLVKLIDQNLDGGSDDQARAETKRYTQDLESQLRFFGEDHRKLDYGEQDIHPYTVHYYEGCLASIRGALDAEEVDLTVTDRLLDQSEWYFDEAAWHFDQVERLASELNVSESRLLPLESSREKLASRRWLRVSRP